MALWIVFVFFKITKKVSCLSCTWNTYWSSSSSYQVWINPLKNKGNIYFEKKVNRTVNLRPARCPTPARLDIAILFKGHNFLKNLSKNVGATDQQRYSDILWKTIWAQLFKANDIVG